MTYGAAWNHTIAHVISEQCQNHSEMSFNWYTKTSFTQAWNAIYLTWAYLLLCTVRCTGHLWTADALLWSLVKQNVLIPFWIFWTQVQIIWRWFRNKAINNTVIIVMGNLQTNKNLTNSEYKMDWNVSRQSPRADKHRAKDSQYCYRHRRQKQELMTPVTLNFL